MFEVKNLCFSYQIGTREVEVLKNLNLKVTPGEFVVIQGPSGSGKSTLFYVLGFLLKPTAGEVIFDGKDITRLAEDDLTVIRNQRIGFIFQQFHLLSKTNTLENILLPTRYPSELAEITSSDREKALSLAKTLGLQDHLTHFPNQLSGGQQQRVAIARALMKDVDLILADEPTGNLDSKNAQQILDLLTELNRQGKTIILITHDPEVAKRSSRVYFLRDGVFTQSVEHFSPAPVSFTQAAHFNLLPKRYSWALYYKIARSVFGLSLESLLRNKTKSLLTMLGVVIGVAAVLAMVTLGQFTKRKILETYETLGVNKLVLRGHSNWNLRAVDAVSVSFKSFNWEHDLIPLKKLFPEIQRMSPLLTTWQSTVTSGGLGISDKVNTYGILPEYLDLSSRKILKGRNLNSFHIEGRSPVCVIGFEIAHRLFPRSNPLGQVLSISDGRKMSFPCRVIGILESLTSNQEWSPPNLQIFVPYTYFQTVGDNWWSTQIHEADIQVMSGTDVEKTGKKIKAYFEQKYGKSGYFSIDSDSTLISQMKRFLNLFSVLLTAIALLSLVVGGIGINNMMLVSVAERIKEFGIRKALGATHRSIRVLVLMESTLLCCVAGLIGLISGFGAYELMIFGATRFVPHLKFEWLIDPLALILSFSSILIVGILSGLVPALRAEKLQVIEALRME